MSVVESQCRFEMCSAKCFLEVINGVSGNSIAEWIVCNVTIKLRGLKFKTVTSGGNSRGRDFHIFINETMRYSVNHDQIVVPQ